MSRAPLYDISALSSVFLEVYMDYKLIFALIIIGSFIGCFMAHMLNLICMDKSGIIKLSKKVK